MCTDNEREWQLEKEFDRFIRREILDAANEYRREKGLPLISGDETDAGTRRSPQETEDGA